MGQLRAEDRAKAAGLFTRPQAESLVGVPVTRGHFLAAARFSGEPGLGPGAPLFTLDKCLAEAAVALGS